MKLFHRFAAASLLGAGMLLATPALRAQDTPTNINPKSEAGEVATKTDYSREQLLTSTVHQAWLLSGKDEANFFSMVEQLAAISASNRGITLPESAAAGRRMGDYIKRSAKADTDQLLFAVVDKAVLMTSKTPVHVAGAKR